MKIRTAVTLLLWTVVAMGCGGGSGGGGGGAGGGGGSGGGGAGGGGGSGGGGGGGGPGGGGGETPNEPGSAAIVFPWKGSRATASTVVVRGKASDPEGVAAVRVNGIPATIAAPQASAALASKPSRQLAAQSPSVVLEEGEVEFVAEIELDEGENDIVVTVEDEEGESDEADSGTIVYTEVPVTFELDADGSRIVGLSRTLTSTGYVQNLVEHDFAGPEQTVHRSLPGVSLGCLRAHTNEYLYIKLNDVGEWELRRVDLTADSDTLVVVLPEQSLDPGAGFRSDIFAADLACSADHPDAYFLVNYAAEDDSDPGKSRIVRIGIDTQNVDTLTETNVHVPSWRASRIELAGPQSLISQYGISSFDAHPLTQIDLPGGAHSQLTSGLDVGGLAFAPALAQDLVYVATFAGIDLVNVSVPSVQPLSGPEPGGDPVVFPQVRSVALDMPNQRLLVGDEELDVVIAVDAASGERSTLISRNVGDGPGLVVPRRFVLSSDGASAYVVDDGGNQGTRLFVIDLADGSRSVVGNLGATDLSVVTGIALDEDGNRVFVAGHDELVEVDLNTEGSRIVASSAGGAFGALTALHLDAAGGRVLLADHAAGAILTLDLVSEQIDVLSKPGENGDGPAFDGIVSLALVEDVLYVANQETEAILLVDIDTGDRATLTLDCPASSPGVFPSLAQVLYNANTHELLISGDGLYAIDLESQSCTQYPRRVPVFEIQVTPQNQILAVYFGMLTHVDRETGEVVIVSK